MAWTEEARRAAAIARRAKSKGVKTTSGGRTISSRGSFEAERGKPTEQFLKEHPKPTSSQRSATQQQAKQQGWDSVGDPRFRKEEHYAKGDMKVSVNYNESGKPIRASLRKGHQTVGLASKNVKATLDKWLR